MKTNSFFPRHDEFNRFGGDDQTFIEMPTSGYSTTSNRRRAHHMAQPDGRVGNGGGGASTSAKTHVLRSSDQTTNTIRKDLSAAMQRQDYAGTVEAREIEALLKPLVAQIESQYPYPLSAQIELGGISGSERTPSGGLPLIKCERRVATEHDSVLEPGWTVGGPNPEAIRGLFDVQLENMRILYPAIILKATTIPMINREKLDQFKQELQEYFHDIISACLNAETMRHEPDNMDERNRICDELSQRAQIITDKLGNTDRQAVLDYLQEHVIDPLKQHLELNPEQLEIRERTLSERTTNNAIDLMVADPKLVS